MAAFEHAVQLGYRYLETDAHCTRDGVLLAFHDDRLDRVTDRTGVIAELDWATVKEARVGGGGPVPLLEDLLAAWPDVRINIDPKHDGAIEGLAAAIRRTGTVDRVCIGSFSERRLARMRALLGPRLCTSLGPRAALRLRAMSALGPLRRLDPSYAAGCAQFPVAQWGVRMIDRALVDHAHELGLQVHVWTIDEPAEMSRLIDLGVDGIMTDEPALLKDVLLARGLWRWQDPGPGSHDADGHLQDDPRAL